MEETVINSAEGSAGDISQDRGAAPGNASAPPRDICVLGYAEETRDLVYALPETAEVWGINMAHAFIYGVKGLKTRARPTYWFQIHPRDWAGAGKAPTGYFGRPKEHLDFLAAFDGTVWMQAVDPDIPNSRAYPLAEVAAAAGRSYFTSTFAYQLGLAWYEHTVLGRPIGSVHVYGVNLTSMDEYIHQKSCVEYWLGRLEQAGVRVDIPDASALLKGKLYARPGADLSDHAFERLQFWKSRYTEAWANVNTSLSMKAELKFWALQLARMAEGHPEQFTKELKDELQAVFDRRTFNLNALSDRSAAELNGALGMVKDNQHWLAITGGVDHRAPQLPDLRLPSEHLSQDWDVPETRAI